MAVTTVRPTSDFYVDDWARFGGGPPLWTHVDDSPNDDSSYVAAQANWPSGQYVAGLGDITVSATQRVKQARIRYRRSSHTNGVPENVYVNFQDLTTGAVLYPVVTSQTNSTAWVEKTGGWYTTGPDGHEWTATTANRAGLRLYSTSGGWARISELYVDWDIRGQGVASAVTVTGQTTSTRPTVSWTYTANADGDPQAIYRIAIFSAAQYGAAGFDPETSPSVWSHGDWTAQTSTTVGADLINGFTYKAYVKSGSVFNTDVWYSTWAASSAFTIAVTPPAVPVLTVASDATVPRLRHLLTVQGRFNALTLNQGSLETDAAGWAAAANCAVARTTAQAADGAASLSLTSTAAGNMSATTPTGVSGFPVKPGTTYTALGSFRTAVSARSCRVKIVWYDAAGIAVSTSTGSSITDATGSWTQATLTGFAPIPTGVFAAVQVEVLSAGAGSEVHYVDKVSLAAGSLTTWTPGGMRATGVMQVEYCDQAAGPLNLAHPQLASGTETLATTAGFYPRTAGDLVESDPTDCYQGSRSLRWDVTAAGSLLDIGYDDPSADVAAWYPVAVLPGQQVTASVYLKASVAYTATLTLATTTPTASATSTATQAVTLDATWRRFYVTATVAADRVYGYLTLGNTSGGATGVSVWVDGVQWEQPASVASELAPGLGQPIVWQPVRSADALSPAAADQTVRVHDEEAPPGTVRLYRARATANPDTSSETSAVSTEQPAWLDPPEVWVLKDPQDSSRAMELLVLELTEQIVEDAQEYHPLGRTRPVVVSDWIGGEDGDLAVLTRGDLEWTRLRALATAQRSLLLFPPTGGHRYIRIRERSWPRTGASGAWQRQLNLPFLETDPP